MSVELLSTRSYDRASMRLFLFININFSEKNAFKVKRPRLKSNTPYNSVLRKGGVLDALHLQQKNGGNTSKRLCRRFLSFSVLEIV